VHAGGKGDLSALGVKTSDAVIYVAPGGAVAAVAFLTIASQCTAAPLDLTVMQADAEDAIEQFEAKHIILFDKAPADGIRAAAEAVKAAGKIMYIHTAKAGDDALPGLFELIPDPTMPQTSDLIPLETGEDDVVLLLRTSGTTSKPKGVPLRQSAIVRNGLLLSGTIEISKEDVCLNAMPLFHIGGLSASVLATLASGGSVTCLDSFSAEKFNAALAAEPQPTWYSAVPTIHMAVVNYLKDEKIAPNHSLRFIRSGAAALTPADGEALSACYGNIPIHGN
jgi:acyl-CoA synthetase (AMP-forming)/AMP-acid ligase II|tara:strand:- start:1701 stop:2540 length:840 start_codon:yes stop_codon:yes gene_type:complete